MARNNNAFIKKQKQFNKTKKHQEKAERKTERQKNSQGGALENMMAYVDENGNITSTPPEKRKTVQ